ncbi:hypothetical protein ABT124_17930 [Streptomyces sp. NPDC001982]|uniref:hypothetical protein n=1 Tax=Streptomyces sp. NPDC001982 TaxID=3154405 RepID=UPI0033302ABA
MAQGQRYFWITNTQQLSALQRRLHEAGGPQLRDNLNRRIRHAAEPIHRDLQQAARNLRVWGPGSKGGRIRPKTDGPPLRATIAGSIRLSVTSSGGARLWSDPGRMPPGWRSMPKNTNDGKWRHPTFGNKHKGGWVNQFATKDWWFKTIRPHMPRLRSEVERILKDVERRLDG